MRDSHFALRRAGLGQVRSRHLVAWDAVRPAIGRREEGRVEAWFLGPKAENADLLRELIGAAVDRHVHFRQAYFPSDPEHISDEIKASAGYQQSVQALRTAAEELFEGLTQCVPFSSLRYQGHMLWDQALPAVVGYLAAVLYNQNNVAAEASPYTTQLEIAVGNELCSMLGYTPPPDKDADPAQTYAWGHITADGSVANAEGLWSARNARYLAVAVAEALKAEPTLAAALPLQVVLPDGRRPALVDLEPWALINLPRDTSLALTGRIARACGFDVARTAALIQPYQVQELGMLEFHRRFLPTSRSPVVLAPATAHYSWPKAATLLGLGKGALRPVPVDGRARMDVNALEKMLRQCMSDQVPVLAVVVVIGSTEESAVDPLAAVVDLRDRLRVEEGGLDFAIHADAAWGGYFASMLREPAANPSGGPTPGSDVPMVGMSAHAELQYRSLPRADSITVDPHKAGYVPYPAGALCYRNSASRDLVSLKAPVVYHGGAEPTVGIYGIEGSKPGAAAAAVWLAHRVIGADRLGYGKILGECLWTSKRLYARLATLQHPQLQLVPLAMLPAERDGQPAQAVARERRWLRDAIVDTTNTALKARLAVDASLAETFRELGSDQVIIAFALNGRDAQGRMNTSLDFANRLNQGIFTRCSQTTPSKDHNQVELFLTSSEFDPAVYGQDFVNAFARRLGLQPEPGVALTFLINTTMDPWTTEVTAVGEDGQQRPFDFLAEIEKALLRAAEKTLEELTK